MTARVRIPVYTDHWMRGDRYGAVVGTSRRSAKLGTPCELYHVKLDKSGKTIKFIANDCEVVS